MRKGSVPMEEYPRQGPAGLWGVAEQQGLLLPLSPLGMSKGLPSDCGLMGFYGLGRWSLSVRGQEGGQARVGACLGHALPRLRGWGTLLHSCGAPLPSRAGLAGIVC